MKSQEIVNNPLTKLTENWLCYLKPNPESRVRLFCFHYLGGGASVFRKWSDHLSPDLEVCPIQMPGREGRIDEQPFVRMPALVETLAEVLYPYLDKPFAFYGHSMGALISFEVARQLRRQYGLNPVHLFVAAYYAPHLLSPFQSLGEWNDSLLIKKLPRLLDAPKSSLENADFLQALLPTVKADLQILSNYTFLEENPLNCPIWAFGGLQDDRVKQDDISAWRKHTSSTFKLEMFPGKHLFLLRKRKLILSAISQGLNQFACI
ncbi:MAG: thioesterase [Moorea sp. SIO3I7]|nr:thioesterase [Moorena sp. SIO3I7]